MHPQRGGADTAGFSYGAKHFELGEIHSLSQKVNGLLIFIHFY
jgi:hypothetical protein